MKDVVKELREASQGKNQMAAQFAAYLDTIEEQIEPLPVNLWVQCYINGLKQELRQRIIEQGDKFDHRSEVEATASQIEAALKEGEISKEKPPGDVVATARARKSTSNRRRLAKKDSDKPSPLPLASRKTARGRLTGSLRR
ncbi:MAG: hypothetical protein M1816_001409 [Peltula sp. TS41687]|nr:MAG: hypothetical protein M1816_001409 [Peltula sp. TS41687]